MKQLTEQMDERLQLMDQKIKKTAENLYEKYREQMDLLEKESLLCKVKGHLDPYDVYALGKQLESFDTYLALCEDDGNLGQLGKIPQIAYDVITVAYGTSVIPFIASVQPIEEESGHVYFKQVRAETKKGSITGPPTTFIDPRTGLATPRVYSGNFVTAFVAGVTVGAQTHYTGSIIPSPPYYQAPVRPQTVKIYLFGGVFCTDDGRGNLVGQGLSGTIDYPSGSYVIDFLSDPGAAHNILADYQIQFEQADDLPRIGTFFDSTTIIAQVYALKGTIGMLQSYGMRKRFGLVAEDELAKDLVAEINAEIGADLISMLYAAALGVNGGQTASDFITWPKQPPATGQYISYFEHVNTFKYYLADAEAVIAGNAQRGTITTMIAGRNAASIMSTLPGFNKLTDGNTLGAHVFGTLDGVMIVRVNEQAVLDKDQVICLWKGTSPFEAPAVYSPFMPLVVTSTLPAGKNPIGQQRAAAVWSGLKILVPQFITKMVVSQNTDIRLY